VAAVVVAIVLLVLVGVIGAWLGERLSLRLMPGREITPARRRRIRMFTALAFIPPVAAAVAFVTGHPAVGIGIMLATFLVPNFVSIALHVRRDRGRRRA
jgi:hypothetical protein